MEVVILDDMVATFNTTWVRIANTSGHEQIKPGDEFQETGALEKFAVEATSFSPVPGASRIRLLRAHHSTKAEVHKSGAVLAKTNEPATSINGAWVFPPSSTVTATSGGITVEINEVRNPAEPDDVPDTIIAGGTEYANPAKRGRGRPKGSLNKPKQPLVPAWPNV